MKPKICPSCNTAFATFRSSRINSRGAESSKLPLLLKCGHTFCESCITKKMVKRKDTVGEQITCSICKHVSILKNGIKDLSTNFYLFGIIGVGQLSILEQTLGEFVPEKVTRKNPPDLSLRKSCMVCDTATATCKCIECNNILCTKCFEMMHKVSAAIKHHQPLPLSISQTETKEEQTCKDHGKLIEYYCLDDNKAICSRCIIEGNYKGRSIISFEEKNKELIGDIESETETAVRVLHHLGKSDDKLASLIPGVKAQMKKVIESINESFLALHTQLQVREMQVMDSLTQIITDMSTKVEEQRDSFALKRVDLETLVKDARSLIENNALVLDSADLLAKLKSAKEVPCVASKKSEKGSVFTWSEVNKKELTDAMESFGSVVGDVLKDVEFLTVDKVPADGEEIENDRTSIVSSLSTVSYGKVSRQVSTVASTADSSESVIIEHDNSDADSDISRVSKRKSQGKHNPMRQPYRESLEMPVVKGRAQKVTVTHIVSPNDFRVQLCLNKRKLETLAHNINTWCRREMSSRYTPSKVEVGMLLLARYSLDKTWYRAKVLGLEDDVGAQDCTKVHVQYIDYGNEEVLPMKELRNMEKRFMVYPVFAVQCCLSDIAPREEDQPWSPDTVKDFQRMAEDRILLMTTFKEDGWVYDVDLVIQPDEDVQGDGFVSIRDILVFLELARFNVQSTEAKYLHTISSYTKLQFIKPTPVKNGVSVDVIVTSAESPSLVYITCKGDERAYYINMLEEMQAMYGSDTNNMYSLYYPRVGTCCSVLEPRDGMWYRAQVVSAPQNRQVSVYLVDTGITMMVSFDQIKKLHNKFVKLPAQAICCRLADIAPVVGSSEDWSPDATVWCKNTMVGAVGIVRMKRWTEPAEIVLWLGSRVSAATSQSINYILVELGFARSTGLSSVGATQDSLYQSGASSDYHQSAGHVRSTRGGTIEVNATRVGASLAAGRSSQGYCGTGEPSARNVEPRAKILEDASSAATVEKNSTEKKKIGKPSVAAAKKSRKAEQRSPASASQQHSGGAAAQSTRLEKEKIQKEIQQAMKGERSTSDDKSGSLYIEIIISWYESPSNFVLRVKDKEDQLEALMEQIQEHYANTSPSEDHTWKVGTFCAVRYYVDEMWYRGKVKSCEGESGSYLVEMLDYGYEEVVTSSELRPLNKELGQQMEVASVRCHIANLVPAGSVDVMKWSRTGIEFMKAETKDRKLYIKQEGDMNAMGLPIDVIIETEIPETAFDPAIKRYHSLRQAILDEGLARPSKKSTEQDSLNTDVIDPFQRVIFEKKCGLVDQSTVDEATLTRLTSEENKGRNSDSGVEEQSSAEVSVPHNIDAALEEVTDTPALPECPQLSVGVPIDVFPTYVDYKGFIYVQPKEWEDMVIHLDCELQRIYGSINAASRKSWDVDELCVAYYPTDDRWYRAHVVELLADDEIKVFYLDYGNSEVVNCNHLRPMMAEFASVHPLALTCQLDDVVSSSLDGQWSVPVLEYIHEMLVNAWCKIIIVGSAQGNPLQVNLIKGKDLDVGIHLVSQSLASRVSDLAPEYERSGLIGKVLAEQNPYEQLDVGGVGDTFLATLTHVELPNLVYLQRVRLPDVSSDALDFVRSSEVARVNRMLDEFDAITEKLNSTKSIPLNHLPDAGLMCAAKYSYDDVWYRALSVKSYRSKGTCLVFYVDFGTAEEVPIDRLRVLASEFWHLPAQAVRVYFNIVPPSGPRGMWRRESISAVIQALACKEIVVRIKQVKPLTAELLVQDGSSGGGMRLAYESVIEGGLALLADSVDAAQLLPLSDDDDDVLIEGRETARDCGIVGVVASSEGDRNESNSRVDVGGEVEIECNEERVDWWAAGENEAVSSEDVYSDAGEFNVDVENAATSVRAEALVGDTTTSVNVTGEDNDEEEEKEEDDDDDDDCNSDEWTTDDDNEEDGDETIKEDDDAPVLNNDANETEIS